METNLRKFIPLYGGQLFSLFLILWPCSRGDASGCKDMIWLPEKSGTYLRNHSIQNMTVSSKSMCRIMCYLSEKTCMSYNFHQSTSTCEINDSDEFQHPDDLIPMHGYSYSGTKNGCQSKPCAKNGICRADFTRDGGFNCICASGFTGEICELDIDECASAHGCPAHQKCLNTIGSYKCLRSGTKDLPGTSCLSILKNGGSQGTGEYWLDPKNTGNPVKVFCDMDTDGGGWTKLSRVYLKIPNIPVRNPANSFDAALPGGLNTDEYIFPTGPAMLGIHQAMGFHQIHFYCHKKSVGRVVSIMTMNNTAGQQVVRYFTTVGAAESFPDACGSFEKLPEDTSVLSQNCGRWGKNERAETEVNKWGNSDFRRNYRITTSPFAIITTADDYWFGCYNDGSYVISSCDDSNKNPSALHVNDTWQIAVR